MTTSSSPATRGKPVKFSPFYGWPCPEEPEQPAGPSFEDIAIRAHQNFQKHGSADGHDQQDWLQAEAELIAEHRSQKSMWIIRPAAVKTGPRQ